MFQTKKEKTMKKTIWSLAALMLMAAPIMTSCNKALDNEAPAQEQGKTVTITIAPPAVDPETKVSIADRTGGFDITGWALNDQVLLYKVEIPDEPEPGPGPMPEPEPGPEPQEPQYLKTAPVTFTCIDAAAGTFEGTLPAGATLSEYQLALYGATAVEVKNNNGNTCVAFKPNTYCSTDVKDVINMYAWSTNGNYSMNLINNIVKVKNASGANIDVAWRRKYANMDMFQTFTPKYSGFQNITYGQVLAGLNLGDSSWEGVEHFTLLNGAVNYVNMPYEDYSSFTWALAKSDNTIVLGYKEATYRTGKLYKAPDIE